VENEDSYKTRLPIGEMPDKKNKRKNKMLSSSLELVLQLMLVFPIHTSLLKISSVSSRKNPDSILA